MIIKRYYIEYPEIITLDIRDNNIVLLAPDAQWGHTFKNFIKDYNLVPDTRNALLWTKSAPPELVRDWAAEIGYMLIVRGCVIDVDNPELAQKIKDNDFKHEKVRWIDYLDKGRFKNWFHVKWNKEDLYERLKKIIPGCRSYNYYLAVPAYLYREIIDFAKDWDFQFTDKARQFLKTAPRNVIVLFENHLKIPKSVKIPDELKHQQQAVKKLLPLRDGAGRSPETQAKYRAC